jgi:putative oxidoreductase
MRVEETTLVALRIGAGFLFMLHGLQKLFGLIGGREVPLASLMGVAGMMELVGGLLLIVGFVTRPVAALLVIEMLVAYATAHMPKGGWPLQNGGELPLLYALVFLYFAGNGAGRFSVDAWLGRRRPRAWNMLDVVRRSRAA